MATRARPWRPEDPATVLWRPSMTPPFTLSNTLLKRPNEYVFGGQLPDRSFPLKLSFPFYNSVAPQTAAEPTGVFWRNEGDYQ